MKLIPLYDIKAIIKAWPFCIDGVEEVLEKTTGETSLAKILNDIMAGIILLWIGFEDNQYVGFITTKINQTPFGYKNLFIIHLFIKPPSSPIIFLDGFKEIKKLAKDQNCKSIHFWSVRDKAFERRLKPLGWNTGYTEFIYNLNQEDN